jgi:hypothetical protein
MKRQQRVFDNEHVSFLHRRFQEHAFESLKQLQKLTMDFAQSSDIEHWQKLWTQNLPTVAYHNTMIQQDMARALLELYPVLEEYAETAYQVYARHTYGRDINGNVNVLQVTFPPFYEFFHTFLTWLCKHPAVSRLEVFANFEVLDAASRAAFCDALCFVLKNRVTIKQTLNKTQYKEKYERPATVKKSRSPSPSRKSRHTYAAASSTSSMFSKSVKRYEDEDDDVSRLKSRSRSPSTRGERSTIAESVTEPSVAEPSVTAPPSTTLTGSKRLGIPSLARVSKSAISYSSKPSMTSSVVQDNWVKNLKQTSSMVMATASKRAEVFPSESASQIMSTGKLFQREKRSGTGTGTETKPVTTFPEARQVTVAASSQSAAALLKKPKHSPLRKSRHDSLDKDEQDEDSRDDSSENRSDDGGGF